MNTHNTPARWTDLVEQGGYITPVQKQAFEKAIYMVTRRLNLVLNQKDLPRSGQFDFDTFVDSLETDFLNSVDGTLNPELNSDVGQTAFWVIRQIADHLINLQKQRHAL
ncbi:DNA-binding protein [Dickeya lacustris]|uniref:DNA-binding protein n=1 Tax=Dickeya lacustris TaxID=2259638 RepID=A0ABY8G7Q8_9GAMM|nr:DNA-binding protein [Dickeya lacustris]WFN55949.1 DNA-binding protein [Dickeya lacustris]